MGIAYNTSIVRDGLVLHLDAANVKSYNPNIIEWGQTFNNGYWSIGGVTIDSTNELAPDYTNTATKISDNSTTQYSRIYKTITVPNDSQVYKFSLYIKKTSESVPKFAVNSGIIGGSTLVQTNQRLNMQTGFVTGASVIDSGEYWRMHWTITNNSTGNTNLYFNIFPATQDPDVSGDNVIYTGSAIIWGVMVTKGSALYDYKPNFGTTGNTWYDLSGNGNHVNLINSPTFNNLTKSFSFDGTNQYLSDVTLSHNNELSAIFVINYQSKGSYHNLFDTVSSEDPMFWIRPTDLLELNKSDGAISPESYENEINMLTAISESLGDSIIYVNNNKVITDTQGADAFSTSPITIDLLNRNGGETFLGDLYSILFYSRVLNESEIRQNFEAMRGRYGI